MSGENLINIDTVLNADVGQALRAMRIGGGFTQRQLARRLAVRIAWIRRRERNECQTDPIEFMRWCTACGYHLQVVEPLLCGTEPKREALKQVKKYSQKFCNI